MAWNDSGYTTMTAAVALQRGQGVYRDSNGEAALTTAGLAPLGIVERDVAAGEDVTIKLHNAPGTFEVMLAGVYSAGTLLYTAAGGKFSTTAVGVPHYRLNEGSLADGDRREAVPLNPAYQNGFTSVLHSTASFTLTKEQAGATITNLGATGAVTVTLPQDAPKGTTFKFCVMAAYALGIQPGAAGGLYINGAKQSDNTAFSADDEGEHATVTADGNGDWIASPITGTWS